MQLMMARARMNHQSSGPTGSILDSLSVSSVGAYSLRKLRDAYVGNCIKVRRSSDSALLDVGFSNGALDSAAVLAFVGTGDGYIYTWYDQSGYGRDFAQVSSAQPKIVSVGALTMQGTKPTSLFSSSRLAATINAFAAGFCVNAVAIVKSGSLPALVDKSTTSGIAAPWMMFGTNGQWNRCYLGDGSVQNFYAPTVPTGTLQVITHDADASSKLANFYANGTLNNSATVSTTYADTANLVTLGGRGDGSTNLQGNLSETILFAAPLPTADRHTLERNQGTYYGIAVA